MDVDTTRASEDAAERILRSAMIGPQQRARLLDEHGLEVDHKNGWLRLHLHRGRQRGMAFMTFFIGTIFVAFMVLIPDEGFTASVMRWAFGSFRIGLLLLAFYLPFNSLDVRINKRKLRRVRSWFGLVIRTQEISAQDLDALEIDKGASSRRGRKTTI